jgi:hypothetical protein
VCVCYLQATPSQAKPAKPSQAKPSLAKPSQKPDPVKRETSKVLAVDEVKREHSKLRPCGVVASLKAVDVLMAELSGFLSPYLGVGRCRLTVSKPELKARLVSAIETKM